MKPAGETLCLEQGANESLHRIEIHKVQFQIPSVRFDLDLGAVVDVARISNFLSLRVARSDMNRAQIEAAWLLIHRQQKKFLAFNVQIKGQETVCLIHDQAFSYESRDSFLILLHLKEQTDLSIIPVKEA